MIKININIHFSAPENLEIVRFFNTFAQMFFMVLDLRL